MNTGHIGAQQRLAVTLRLQTDLVAKVALTAGGSHGSALDSEACLLR